MRCDLQSIANIERNQKPMNHLKSLTCAVVALVVSLDVWAQGYIVPNGVVYVGSTNGVPYEVDVIYNPTNLFYTGFVLNPVSSNSFRFFTVADVGVRVFLVRSNTPVNLEPITAGDYPELLYPNTYSFASGTPFYVGLYTGNQLGPPVNGIYSDPLFGWAELVNDKGVIELLDGAMAYKAGGIYAGTQTIFDVPEPSVQVLFALACLLLSTRRRKTGYAV
jgi:hypothetical protein